MTRLFILTIGVLISYSFTNPTSQSTERFIFKTVYQASYSVKRSGELKRKKALKRNASQLTIYDSSGVAIEYWNYETDGSVYEKTKLVKDESGNLLKSTTYDKNGNLKSFIISEFDENVRFYRRYNSKSELISVQENKLDSNGNVVVSVNTLLSSNKTFKTVDRYSAEGLLIKQTDFNVDGTVKDVRTFKYDEDGNETESELSKSDGGYTKFVSTYDERNNILTQHWFDKDEKPIHSNSFQYIYDENGNWLTRKRFSDGELGFVWERRIEYF